jgi:outer membrane translocation and assembly module TamA
MFPASGEINESIPINERFFLGGGNTVRGYSERSLGPKDDEGNPLGGTLYLVGNFELRHRIHKKLFGVAFVGYRQPVRNEPRGYQSPGGPE